jgi:hypothetical protein
MNSTQKQKNEVLIFILGLLIALGPLSIDMYLTGFSVIASDLSTSIEKVGYSLSSFFIGICSVEIVKIKKPPKFRFGGLYYFKRSDLR